MRWSDLRDGVDIHEVLYTGPLVYLGCMNSLDWTTGLDYWTGLLDSLKNVVYTILRADRGQGHFKGHQEAQPH